MSLMRRAAILLTLFSTLLSCVHASHQPLRRHHSLAQRSHSLRRINNTDPSMNHTIPYVPAKRASAADDIAAILERRLTFIVAGAGDASDISSWLSTLQPNGKWPDDEVDYTTGCDARRANWPAQTHWTRLVTMSAAWHGGLENGDQYVQNPILLAAISSAMDYWFENDFTDLSCIDSGGTSSCPCGTPGFWNTNWFSNIILIPNLVAQTCLLVVDQLTTSQHDNCTHITSRSYGTFDHNINGAGILTGANLLDVARIGIDEGLLNNNISQLTDAYGRIHGELVLENLVKADGIRPDGSFGQHGGILYNGNYGKDFTNDVLLLEIDAGGTQFEASATNQAAFATLIDGDQWMIYRNIHTNVLHWDFSVLGRFISFPVIDAQATGSININVTEIQQLGQEWGSDTLTSVAESLSTASSSANVGNLNGNRLFYDNDYMTQRGPGYVTTVKMYSNRTKNTECTNDQNPLGFHLSDGTVYTYMQGDEYEDIAVAWDWNLIPGITVDYNATALTCDDTEFTGKQAFVGGVSDGTVGIAAMRYTNPLTKALSWQKAWFFVDDDIQHVMVNVLSSTSGAPVYSVLDQKKHKGEIIIDGLVRSTQSKSSNSKPATLWHDNVGYTFDQSKSAYSLAVEVGPETGNWSNIGISTQGIATVNLFAAWIQHTPSTVSSPISYTVYPAVAHDAFLVKSASTQLRQIRNDQDVSAVYDAAHRIAFVVFWDKTGGSIQLQASPEDATITINSTANAAVLYRLDTGNVTVSDPSQTLSTLKLTFTASSVGKRPSQWGSSQQKVLAFTLPTGGLAGSSTSQIL